ncbi:FAD-binding oxidoreductase [Streptomyces sp. RB6PN25]|uniref:FAD-binding oxidoreductase n=1 Tax=Streptomyces humicola TaxID=2953240 RepID=A0ABT1Q441_9ACTN|nr:FAD-dependent oxidoreductase [Streptomyces humicola]MCQ4083512.1 FAD-binding oxidoreductase [Streptomyces humicola]
MPRSNDVIVIGNGALGSSIAFELARRGNNVARIGGRARRHAASTAAGAMLGCFGEVTEPLMATEHGRYKLSLDYQARELWPDWLEGLSAYSGDESELVTADGTFVILNSVGTSAIDTTNFAVIEAALTQHHEPYELVDTESIDWMEPNELFRPLRALFMPREHAVNTARLFEKLDAALIKAQGVVVEEQVTSLVTDGDSVAGVVLANGETLTARHVIVAAGAHSVDLLAGLEDLHRKVPPMVSGYGVSALVRTKDRSLPRSVLRTPNRALACGLHCVPRGDGMLYLGATNIISDTPRENADLKDLKFLVDCAIDQLHTGLEDAALVATQVGNRPIPADGYPLFGATGVDGLWMASGTYRDGLNQSPLLAREMADMIEKGAGQVRELIAFAPVRAPLAPGTREQVVASAVSHMVATGYERKWNITGEWPGIIEEALTEKYLKTANDLDAEFTPPAEFLVTMSDQKWEALRRYYAAWR